MVADVLKTLDPPKSSLERRTLMTVPPLLRGERGDLDTTLDLLIHPLMPLDQ
jgi:hypothetical protein